VFTGFETYVVADASLHFHESWAREAALELESAGVQLCTHHEVDQVSREFADVFAFALAALITRCI
jgi:nicotinamidase-related amidase